MAHQACRAIKQMEISRPANKQMGIKQMEISRPACSRT